MFKRLCTGMFGHASFRLINPFFLIVLMLVTVAGFTSFWAPNALSAPAPNDEAALLDGYRHVEVASVSDALEKLSGQRMYMSHRMRPIFSSIRIS